MGDVWQRRSRGGCHLWLQDLSSEIYRKTTPKSRDTGRLGLIVGLTANVKSKLDSGCQGLNRSLRDGDGSRLRVVEFPH